MISIGGDTVSLFISGIIGLFSFDISLVSGVILIILFLAWLYAIYKVIWYITKMLILWLFMKRLARNDVKVEHRRSFLSIIFGRRGYTDYVITYGDKKYEVSVLSFISTHGRWNIEKTRTSCFIECRRASKAFYKTYVNTAVPDHVAEYKRESRVCREELYISPIDSTFEKQIFLLYPYPKCVTHCDSQYKELSCGQSVEGHVIMDIKELKKLF